MPSSTSLTQAHTSYIDWRPLIFFVCLFVLIKTEIFHFLFGFWIQVLCMCIYSRLNYINGHHIVTTSVWKLAIMQWKSLHHWCSLLLSLVFPPTNSETAAMPTRYIGASWWNYPLEPGRVWSMVSSHIQQLRLMFQLLF